MLVRAQVRHDEHSKNPYGIGDVNRVVPKIQLQCTLGESVEVAYGARPEPFHFLHVEFEAVGIYSSALNNLPR